ncbi:DNA-methyltransferase [Stenotrophomonas bentonitica]|uniref:DNA-methyltransferase n=1 Tax=Stenotrophomonas bentonitica TaxID=1450134 RepID=UPI0037CDF875
MIHVGDCLTVMRGMADQSVQTCITSPPYFGLRDYGVDGQIGLEPTPAEFVARLVEVFREVRRVLRDDGTLWLNLGDSYASSAGGYTDTGSRGTTSCPSIGAGTMAAVVKGHLRRPPAGLKPKDLIGIPWRVAFALQQDGWYLRQDIIWSKPNPMPESVKDRCTKAHEYMFLLSKSPDYYYDQGAIREPAAPSSLARWAQDVENQAGSDRAPGKTNGAMRAVGGRSKRDSFARAGAVAEHVLPGQSVAQHRAERQDDTFDVASRNKRSVWTVPTMPFKEAHFATFPERLIEPCVLAGAPAGGVVLDPFMGAGTTAVVAERLGRRWVGCELNPEYAAIAEARIRAVQPGLALGDAA